jgi:CheY-like chemotaxis protein
MSVLQTLSRAAPLPEQEPLLGLGLRAGMTLTTLVSDILDVARADAGRITLDIAVFSPAQSLRDIVDIHRVAATAKGLTLDLECEPGLPALLLGDRIRIEQIIGNLVSNAVLYTRQGGVRVTGTWRDALRIEVADTGPGVDPGILPDTGDVGGLVLAPGNRSAGLGLGLQICRRLVHLMNGTLEHGAVPGGGSCFRVCLPLVHAPAVSAAPPDAARMEPRLRILLVEDDEIADTALALSACDAFDVILLDMQLSPQGLSGLDIIRRIRALPTPFGQTQVFALTGDGLEQSHAIYEAAGLDGLILKPLVMSESLRAVLDRAKWRKAEGGARAERV